MDSHSWSTDLQNLPCKANSLPTRQFLLSPHASTPGTTVLISVSVSITTFRPPKHGCFPGKLARSWGRGASRLEPLGWCWPLLWAARAKSFQHHAKLPEVCGAVHQPLDSAVCTYLCFCFYPNLDDARGRHQKKIRSKTQNYLNLYAVEGLRTLCIAKRVSGCHRHRSTGADRHPQGARRLYGTHQCVSCRF